LPVSPSMSGATGVLSSNSTSREKTVFPEWLPYSLYWFGSQYPSNRHSDDRGPSFARCSFGINTQAREPMRRRCNSEGGFQYSISNGVFFCKIDAGAHSFR
jgi:hypothetical protein